MRILQKSIVGFGSLSPIPILGDNICFGCGSRWYNQRSIVKLLALSLTNLVLDLAKLATNWPNLALA